MGAFGKAFATFAQPLIDGTDGSPEQLQQAMTLSQLCWNLALVPQEKRDEFLAGVQPELKMDDEEFADFKRTIVTPMIERHHELFPGMSQMGPIAESASVAAHEIARPAPRRPTKKYAGTGRNEPCPCGSGTKYKRCCGR
ncbi:SEC-C metal-binding domain-containing protein [uncultured Thiodictyon sp.]|uniref:SEC-C metal-binding domain-containing protein n=1 Tax=uncultured Thiodictyon sp. TaxID=1846217 RepID=UPI0025EEABF8|nr:SEC-C metal-binding domain-containing protein [uncultured Thiodictyon sp.]